MLQEHSCAQQTTNSDLLQDKAKLRMLKPQFYVSHLTTVCLPGIIPRKEESHPYIGTQHCSQFQL